MARVKSVRRTKAEVMALAPKSNTSVRPSGLIQSSESSESQEQTNEEVNTPATTAAAQPQAETPYTKTYPTPEPTIDDIIEVKARIRQSTRKKYPGDVPPAPRPPFLPQAMQTGCIQISKFKCLTAPTATDGKADWDPIKYCLDCLRPHLFLFCDGTHMLVTQDCSFHQANPDTTLRVNEYDRVRKRLETTFHNHGTIDSRPFTPPIVQHRPGCGHQSELDGFGSDLVADLKETAQWNKDDGEDDMQAAAPLKIDTPSKGLPQSAFPRPTPANEDVIMIDD